MAETCEYAPIPITYRNNSAIVQTTKLARLRGKRMRISSATNGSRMKAMITAVIDVIKNTRPKYRIAITAAKADAQAWRGAALPARSPLALRERLGDERHGPADDPCLECIMAPSIMKLTLTPPLPASWPSTSARSASDSRSATRCASPRRGFPISFAPTSAPTWRRSANWSREREVGLFLMGNPINMRGTEGRQSGWVREFAGRYRDSGSGLPVQFWDERLTSVEAGRVLRSSGISIEKRAAAVDRLSAVILLQSYLDSL